MYEALGIESKLQWRLQEVREVKDGEPWLRKSVGSDQCQTKKEALWIITSKDIGMELHKLSETTVLYV